MYKQIPVGGAPEESRTRELKSLGARKATREVTAIVKVYRYDDNDDDEEEGDEEDDDDHRRDLGYRVSFSVGPSDKHSGCETPVSN